MEDFVDAVRVLVPFRVARLLLRRFTAIGLHVSDSRVAAECCYQYKFINSRHTDPRRTYSACDGKCNCTCCVCLPQSNATLGQYQAPYEVIGCTEIRIQRRFEPKASVEPTSQRQQHQQQRMSTSPAPIHLITNPCCCSMVTHSARYLLSPCRTTHNAAAYTLLIPPTSCSVSSQWLSPSLGRCASGGRPSTVRRSTEV